MHAQCAQCLLGGADLHLKAVAADDVDGNPLWQQQRWHLAHDVVREAVAKSERESFVAEESRPSICAPSWGVIQRPERERYESLARRDCAAEA